MDDRHTDLHPDQRRVDTQSCVVGVQLPATSDHCHETHTRPAGGTFLHPDHDGLETQTGHVGVQLPATSQLRGDTHTPPAGGTFLHPDHASPETQHGRVGVQPPATSQKRSDTQGFSAGGTFLHPDNIRPETQPTGVGVQPPATSQGATETQTSHAGGTSEWHALGLWADMLHDAQEQRKAQGNRVNPNKAYGLGHIDADLYAPAIKSFEATEKLCEKALVATFRRTAPPAVVEWVKNTRGLGEPSMARLLGHLGHPVWATPYHWEGTGKDRTLVADSPYRRTVSQLWQYCGHGAPARRRKGMTAEELAAQGSPNLKARLWNVSVCCVKTVGSPYRDDVYLASKDATIGKLHTSDCPQCHAKEGDPWRDGHRDAHAKRMVGKAILRDLWILSQ